MKTILIPVNGSGLALVAGIVWRPFARKNPSAELRMAAKKLRATAFTVVGKRNAASSFYGFIKDTNLKRGKLFSLATALYKVAPKDGAGAVVLKHDSYYAVCCINKGAPVLDVVLPTLADAVSALNVITKKLNITPNANFENQVGFKYVQDLETKLLGPKKQRVKPLADIPSSPIKPLLIAGTVLVGLAWYVQEQNVEAQRLYELQQQQIRDADPVPKYLNNKNRREPYFAIHNETLMNMVSLVEQVPTKPEGWLLESVKCEQSSENQLTPSCKLNYQRLDGNYSGLKNYLGRFELIFESPNDMNKAVATATFDGKPFILPQYEKNFRSFIDQDFGDQSQDWLTAGIGISMTAAALWPETSGVAKSFTHPNAILAGEFKFMNVPVHLFRDLINTKPKNVHIKSFEMKHQVNENEANIYVTVDAAYHVKQ